MKWGEYANDVQFILQRSGNVSSNSTPNNPKCNEADSVPYFAHERNKDTRKSLIFNSMDLVYLLTNDLKLRSSYIYIFMCVCMGLFICMQIMNMSLDILILA